ncbi:MAG: DUF4440 domain-containing protein [Deltaproteobacteria bacterium]|nr:DUF4440 domain-containing protein [Deltaproteobacteria bacterium]
MRRLTYILGLWAFLWLVGGFSLEVRAQDLLANSLEAQPEIAELWPDSILDPGQANLILVVDKSHQELRIYRTDDQGNLILLKTIPCSTGMAQGDKLVRGDKKTPEGYYIFRQKLLPEELPDIYGILAYPMDYPNFWDLRVGRGGDGIWTHGVNKPLVDYDSNGCVELLNHDIAALEDAIRLFDTPIIVAGSLILSPAEKQKKIGQAARAFLESWRSSWANKNHAAYRSHYSPNFVNSEKRDFEGWMEHKKRVAGFYSKITVELRDIRIFRHRDVIVASFIQRYKGDERFRSDGFKRLYIGETSKGFEILAEDFDHLPGPRPNKWLSPDQKMAALTTPPLAVASVSAPIAVASAGVLAPIGPSKPSAPTPPDEAASAESARVALEAGLTVGGADKKTRAEDSRITDNIDDNIDQNSNATLVAKAQIPKAEDPKPANQTSSASPETKPSVAVSPPTVAPPTGQTTNGSPLIVWEPKPVIAPPGPIETPPAPLETKPEVGKETQKEPETKDQPKDAVEAELKTLALKWLEAWNKRDKASYFEYYDASFHLANPRLKLSSFKKYRARLFAETKVLKISGSNWRVTVKGDQAQMKFTQNYQSDTVRDRGEKTLVWRRNQGQWRIIEESWLAKP